MDRLSAAENQAIFIIREAAYRFRNPALLWSIGKDSTAMLHLARKAFLGRLPFPVLHIDTGYKFEEIYAFKQALAVKWGFKVITLRNEKAIAESRESWPWGGSKLKCCGALKTEALKQGIRENGFDAVFVGIRRDEHGIRAKERTFSPREADFKWNYTDQRAELWDQYLEKTERDDHVRVHPILQMTESDIWLYTRQEDLPVCPLYFSKNGRRYRSIGCAPCCEPVSSEAATIDQVIWEIENSDTAERAGRAQDKEDAYTMQTLRSLGYL